MFDLPPRSERGRMVLPRNPWSGVRGVALAFQMCRYQDADGVTIGLAHHVKRVPEDYTARACTIGHGPECWVVRCPCGATEFVAAELVSCRGECGRWFFADEVSAWAIRLPEQDLEP